MITNPEWLKPKEKPYFHQISMDCLEKLVDCIAKFNKGEIDADTSCQIEKQILVVVQNDTNNFSLPSSPIKRVKIVFYVYDKKGQTLFNNKIVSTPISSF